MTGLYVAGATADVAAAGLYLRRSSMALRVVFRFGIRFERTRQRRAGRKSPS